jgi:chorismate mutase/prephenate dehydratase
MDKLQEARKIISQVDEEMAALFVRRMEAAVQVAEYKKERGLPVFDSQREDEVVRKNMEYITDDELKAFYENFIKYVMDISKDYQQKLMK